MIELINTEKNEIELYKFRVIKNFIKENVKINQKGELQTNILFDMQLLELIKYIDLRFYNELKQQGAEHN